MSLVALTNLLGPSIFTNIYAVTTKLGVWWLVFVLAGLCTVFNILFSTAFAKRFGTPASEPILNDDDIPPGCATPSQPLGSLTTVSCLSLGLVDQDSAFIVQRLILWVGVGRLRGLSAAVRREGGLLTAGEGAHRAGVARRNLRLLLVGLGARRGGHRGRMLSLRES